MEANTAMNNQGLPWFAVYIHHQHEKSVARFLSEKGLEVFLPLYPAVHQWKDRVKRLSLPLFPNYLFVSAQLEWCSRILQTPGIYDFVRCGKSPAPIPVEELQAVRRVIENGSCVQPHSFLKFGDRIRLKRGPLEGLEGILVRKKNGYRLVISVELLVRSVAVEVDALDVERAAGSQAANRFIDRKASA